MAGAPPFESELLMWKNPVKTGGALACLNALFFFAVYTEGSLVPWLCNASMLAIFAGGAAQFAAPGLAEKGLAMLPSGAAEALVRTAAEAAGAAASKAHEAVWWSSPKFTIKTLIALEVVRRLAPWISLYFLLFLGGNGLFMVPYALEAKKEVIEKSIGPHINKAYSLRDDLLAKVPKYTDVVKDE